MMWLWVKRSGAKKLNKSAPAQELTLVEKPRGVPSKYYLWMNLTGREKEVAALAAEGKSNEEIARELSISVGTVKVHMHRVLDKLQIKAREELPYIVPPIVEYDKEDTT